MKNQFFIGMGTFEDLLDVWGSNDLILNTCIESLPSNHPSIRFKKFAIVAARIDSDKGICYYWRLHTGSVDDWGHGHSDGKLEAAHNRTVDAMMLLSAYAASVRNFTVIKALVAMPKDLTYLDGSTELICYDKEKDTYLGTAASGHEADVREAAA